MQPPPPRKRNPFFGPLPVRGVWTALELTRTQFLAIVVLAVTLFVFIGGPVWKHAHASHFWRIGLSYAVIPIAVSAALYQNGKASPAPIVVASIVISLVKLVVTVALLVVVGMSQS